MGAFYQRALICYRQRRYAMAREELERELAESPANPDAHSLTALCFVGEQNYQSARAAAERAILAGPENAFAHYSLAWVFVRDLKYACRRLTFSTFTTDPAALRRQCLKLADGSIREALRLAPASADYFGLLAVIRYDLGDHRGAIKASEQGLVLVPTQNDCLRVLSLAHRASGQIEAAHSYSTAAVANDPQSVDNHLLHGRTVLLLGDWRGALEHYRDAMRIDPNSAAARRGLVNGLQARNPVYRTLLAARGPFSIRKPRRLFAFLLTAVAVIALPIGPSVVEEEARAFPSSIRSHIHWLAMATALPSLFFLGSSVWTIFLLRFDPVGKHLLSFEERCVPALVLASVTWLYLYGFVRGFFGPHWDDSMYIFWGGLGAAALASIPWFHTKQRN